MSDSVPLLAPVLAAAVLGRSAELEGAVDACLEGGVEPTALREALLMVPLFAGFPRALDTFAVAVPVLRRRGAHDPATESGLPVEPGSRRELFRARGRALFGRVYGESHERVLAGLLELDPEVPGWILEDAYGRVLARPGLDAGAREVLAVVMLCALSLERQLVGHVRGALRCGAAPADVLAALHAAGSLLPGPMIDVVEAELA